MRFYKEEEKNDAEFAKKVWSMWSWFTPWAVVEDANVHNILGPPLPGED